jgi:hypothetical protein
MNLPDMKRSNILIILLGILSLSVILVITQVPVLTGGDLGLPGITRDDYDVYSALITGEYQNDNLKILLSRNTINTSGSDQTRISGDHNLPAQLPALQTSTYNNFRTRNLQGAKLSTGHLPSTVSVLDENEIKLETDRIFSDYLQKDGMERGNQSRLPVILRVSGVGFNPEKNQAFVYATAYCGPTCGSGNYYLFSKIQDNWSISDQKMIWIS